MSSLTAIKTDERVKNVRVTSDALTVSLFDGRAISVPLSWYPRLLKATARQRSEWKPCGGGYGIYWPAIDEHLSVDGLLRGTPARAMDLRPGIDPARLGELSDEIETDAFLATTKRLRGKRR